jgi:hypothetical protein
MGENSSDIRACKSNISNLEESMGAFDDQIERLSTAMSTVSTIYDDDVSFVDTIPNYTPDTWEGSKYDKFIEKKDSTKERGTTYCDNVKAAYEELQAKKQELEDERSSAGFSLFAQKAKLEWLSFLDMFS